MADQLRTELAADALANALAARDPAPGVIFHAGRGCQYTCAGYATLTEDHGVILPHGRTGQCWDNALAGSFFGAIRGGLPGDHAWPGRTTARHATPGTSPGTTAPVCTQPPDTRHPPDMKPPPGKTTLRP
jgi:putative transposase